MDFSKLDLTEAVRKVLYIMQMDRVDAKILKFLYEINLHEGQIVAGRHREASYDALQKNLMGVNVEVTEHNSRELAEILGLDWTNCSNIVTRLQREGILLRSKKGRQRFVSMKWDVLIQVHEALTTGRIVPAKDLKQVYG